MKTPLRILHLEADPKDAELIRATLAAAGFAPDIVVVQTKADYLAQLDQGWELVLADYKLPQFDGLQALALFKERGLEVAFILISGTIGEEAAVAAMQAGASDYVLKNRLARLGPAVERGLRESVERRARTQAEAALRESEEHLSALIDSVEGIVWEADAVTLQFTFVSSQAERLLGYPLARWLEEPTFWAEHIHPDDRESAVDYCVSFTQANRDHEFEYRMLAADGRSVWLRDIVTVVSDNGQAVKLRGLMMDITALKEVAEQLRHSAERTRRLVRASSVGLWEWNLLTDAVYFSPEWKGQLGYADDEIANRIDEWQKRVHPEDLAGALAAVSGFVAGRLPRYVVEIRLLHRDGSWRWIHGEADLERNEKGEPVKMMGSQIDITDHKRIAEALRESDARWQFALEGAGDGVWDWDVPTDAVFFSKRFIEIRGYTEAEVGAGLAEIGAGRKQWSSRLHPEDMLRVTADLQAHLAGVTASYTNEHRVRCKDGSYKWILDRGLVITRDAAGNPLRMVGTSSDITARKQAELREATNIQTMTALAGGAPLAEVLTTLVRGVEAEHPGTLGSVLLLDAAGAILLTGAAPSLPTFYTEAIHGVAIGPAVGSCGTAAFTGERVLVADIQTDPLWTDFKALAAQAGLAACWSEPIRGTRGQVVGTFAFYRAQPRLPSEAEIGTIMASAQLAAVAIERTQATEALRRSTQLLDASQATAKLGGWELDLGTNQLFWTAETYRIHDTSPEEFNPTVDAGVGYFLPESRRIISAALQAAMERGEGYDLVLETLTTKGRRIDVRTTCAVTLHDGRPAKLTGIFQDITERKTLETQMITAQRHEAIGALASGLAHDFNNILTPMLLVTDLLAHPNTDSGDRDLLGSVKTSAERGAAIVRQLLAYSRGAEGERQLVALTRLIEQMTSVARATFPRDITVTEDAEVDLWPLVADITQIQQVLMNLCLNARDAMPSGGNLSITAMNVELVDGDLRLGPSGHPGRFVHVAVRDTGTGIPGQIIDQIFEPFFTTKAIGKGSGLGLSSVLGIVRSHGGSITVDSTLAHGTTFHVYLPATGEVPPTRMGEPTPAPTIAHGATILVVDDEVPILRVTQRCLEKNGYRVLTATNGQEALQLFVAHQRDIQLVLTDLMMPVMGGVELARALHLLTPGMRVIGASGLGPMTADGIDELLEKPFTVDALLAAVGRQLSLPTH